MKTKFTTLSLVLVLISTFVAAQNRVLHQLPNFDNQEVHWGFYLGLNQRDFKVSYQESDFKNTNVTFDNQIGFNVGLIADLRINDHFNLRFEPGLSSNAGTIHFVDQNHENGLTPTNVFNHESAEITSTYLHAPIIFKASAARLNNIRPYVLGGVSLDYNFSGSDNFSDDNKTGNFRMKKVNFMYEVGFGMDFYFHYFKFSPSIRGVYSITNELVRDKESPEGSPYTDPILFMGSRGLFLKLAFE